MILCYFVCFHFSIISNGSKVTSISKTPIIPKLKLNGLSFYRINYPIVLVILSIYILFGLSESAEVSVSVVFQFISRKVKTFY